MKKNIQSTETADKQISLPYKHCLNCGTELKGIYCHSCGQEAVDKTPTVKSFIYEYFDHAIKWDHNFLPTFWHLIRRPGYLTNEYNAGKFISQEHPLKLNMFLLLVFITMFVFFGSEDKLKDSFHNLTNDERFFSMMQVQTLVDDEEYAIKIQESPRDTIHLQAPLALATDFPQIISNIEIIEDTKGENVDKWVAVLPKTFIDDKILVADNNGYYYFNKDIEIDNEGLYLVKSVWEKMVTITSHYFPILLLLTVPFLSFSLRLVQRKSKIPAISHFIFALHYTAFLELLMIFFYLLHLTINPPMEILEIAMTIGSCLYLAIAYHRVYPSSWIKSIIKSLFTNFIYQLILLSILFVIFIACIIIVVDMN